MFQDAERYWWGNKNKVGIGSGVGFFLSANRRTCKIYTSTCPISQFDNIIKAPNVLLQLIFVA